MASWVYRIAVKYGIPKSHSDFECMCLARKVRAQRTDVDSGDVRTRPKQIGAH